MNLPTYTSGTSRGFLLTEWQVDSNNIKLQKEINVPTYQSGTSRGFLLTQYMTSTTNNMAGHFSSLINIWTLLSLTI